MTTQRSASPHFTPRTKMVGWFDPRILALTGWNAVSAHFFATFLDKREIEALLDSNPTLSSKDPGTGPVGIDYVADVGDGFDPTFAIAWHLAKDEIDMPVAGSDGQRVTLPRGDYLIMGGDEVYPAPTRTRYLNQTIGPYAAAFPVGSGGDPQPELLALPGNHDWYDGLSLFIEQFCIADAIGGWRLPQDRSYFALPLPHGWWLWGVDSGLGGHIDPPQVEYFQKQAVRAGDRIILCWAAPTWTHGDTRPGDHDLLSRFVAETVTSRGAAVPLYLSGDSHHFAHYKSSVGDVHWVTAGGGGAFLHPTHHLKDNIELLDADGVQTELQLQSDPYPDKRSSRRMLIRLLLFPRSNPSFLLFTAALHLILAWAVQFGLRDRTQTFVDAVRTSDFGEVWGGFVRNPVSLLLGVLVVAGFTGFAKPRRQGTQVARTWGTIHGALHVLLALLLIRRVSEMLADVASPGWFTVAFLLLIACLGSLSSSLLVGLYLAISNVFGMHDNEAFSALHDEGFKNFLRMRIDGSGSLTVHVIGRRHPGRGWRPESGLVSQIPPCDHPARVKPVCIRTIEV